MYFILGYFYIPVTRILEILTINAAACSDDHDRAAWIKTHLCSRERHGDSGMSPDYLCSPKEIKQRQCRWLYLSSFFFSDHMLNTAPPQFPVL